MPIYRTLPQLGYYLLSYGLLRGPAPISLVHVVINPHCEVQQPAPRDEGQILSSTLPFPVQPSLSAGRVFLPA